MTDLYWCEELTRISLRLTVYSVWLNAVCKLLCVTKAPVVRHVGLWCRLHCLAIRSSLISTRSTRHTAAVIASFHATQASWLLRSRTQSTSRSRRTTCGVKELTSERSNEASFPPLTPPISAYLTTVRFHSFQHAYFFNYLKIQLFI